MDVSSCRAPYIHPDATYDDWTDNTNCATTNSRHTTNSYGTSCVFAPKSMPCSCVVKEHLYECSAGEMRVAFILTHTAGSNSAW